LITVPAGEPRFYYVGNADNQMRPIIFYDEKDMVMQGTCTRVRASSIYGSKANEGYDILMTTVRKRQKELQVENGKFMHALRQSPEAAEIVKKDMAKIDQQQIDLLDSYSTDGKIKKYKLTLLEDDLHYFPPYYAAFMTSGEKHLRKEIGFRQPTKSDLNLGNFDWTIDLWFNPSRQSESQGVLFEIGTGPRAENSKVTILSLDNNLENI